MLGIIFHIKFSMVYLRLRNYWSIKIKIKIIIKIMNKRTEKDFWIEMSIREIHTQAHFAELSFSNIDVKAMKGTDLVFSSIFSFLSHCAIVSKMIKPEKGD